ncbi:MAG: hypothetical protein JXA54_14210 [Candidatus Heimdallarchaeota archaeon]|nr:hypothetical protein [Candidatus Heimdallarchaeota archaeon]
MKDKAIVIIILYLSIVVSLPINNNVQVQTKNEAFQAVFENSENSFQKATIQNAIMESRSNSITPISTIQPLDLITPSYTTLAMSEEDPILEGTEIALSSRTTSAGYGVSSGNVDFLDLNLYKIDNDPTSDTIYSNRFAMRINLPTDLEIEGFAVDISPTIREDVRFYIKTSLTGTSLVDGTITGYIANSAHITNQMLYVPFLYCGGAPITLIAGVNYYFVLEPTISSSSTFFELTQSSDQPNNIGVYEWWNNNYESLQTDVNFYLISDTTLIASDVSVNSNGEATAQWDAIYQGDHCLVSWYKRSTFYAESFGSEERTIIPTSELLDVSLSSIITDYRDFTTLEATIKEDELTPVVNKTVTFSITEDGQSWNILGSSLTNIEGIATLNHQFTQLPGNYTIQAKVNEFSIAESFVLIEKETLVWENINLYGNYRNNPGSAQQTSFKTTLLVKDNDGDIVSNIDFNFFYKIDGSFEWIPHYFSTNISGYADIAFALEDISIGHYIETHYFSPASYETGYIGNSNYGDTIIDKGKIDVELLDHAVEYFDDVKLVARAVSLYDGWEGIVIQFYYNDGISWHFLDYGISNSTGYVEIIWENMPLILGTYLLRAEALPTTLFYPEETIANLFVNRKGLSLYIMNSGEAKGNGEVINIQYTSEMHLVFYVCYEDGKPATNVVIAISGRLIDDLFYRNLGYTSTDALGYAYFNSYENLTWIGYLYMCRADIAENSMHESAALYFKINLIKCTPVIYFADHFFERGTYTNLVVQVKNFWGAPLRYVHVEFEINGIFYQGISDSYGYVKVLIAPEVLVGEYLMTCRVIEDNYFAESECDAYLIVSKGRPYFTLFNSYGKYNGYIQISAKVVDAVGRPIPYLTVGVSFLWWNEILSSDKNGLINYVFQLSGFDCGYYLLVLSFNGNNQWYETTSTANVLIYEEESDMDLITPPITAEYGDDILIEAVLTTTSHIPLENRIVEFYIILQNGTVIYLGQSITNAQGYVAISFTVLLPAGSYEIEASYLGAIDFGPSTQNIFLTIEKSEISIYGLNFNAIIDSTTTFFVTVTTLNGQPIPLVKLSIFIWIDNSWLFLGDFKTNSLGIAEISLLIPFNLGTYSLKIAFSGNEYFNDNFLLLSMKVIAAPPKVNPNVQINSNKLIAVDNEKVIFEITVSNAITGSTMTMQFFVNGIYNNSFYVINGYGQFIWHSTKTGIFNLSFISLEDSVYLVSTTKITIEIILNTPPIMTNYFLDDYICEGETSTIETIITDGSGVKSVWLTANGTIYEMVFNGNVYTVTLTNLIRGTYILFIYAEDDQDYLSINRIDDLHVLERKTQVMKYFLSSRILEQDQKLYFETLLYSINALTNVYLIINSTEYTMTLGYTMNEHKSVWYISLNSLQTGNYEIKVKIVENSSNIIINSLSEIIVVIPITPQITSYNYLIERNKEIDYLTGTLVVDSYYDIESVEIWVDGERATVNNIKEFTYEFNIYIVHEKSHLLIIKISDVNGRVLYNEITIGKSNSTTIIGISISISIIVLVVLMGGGIFVALKQQKKNQIDDFTAEIALSDIPEENYGLNFDEEIDDEFRTQSGLRGNPSNSLVAPAMANFQENIDDIIAEELDSINMEVEPKLDQVKDYIAKVKEVGLLSGKSDGNGIGMKSITDLSTLDIEIDPRLLPENERLQKLAEKEIEESLQIPNLKDITEEIELTFVKKQVH